MKKSLLSNKINICIYSILAFIIMLLILKKYMFLNKIPELPPLSYIQTSVNLEENFTQTTTNNVEEVLINPGKGIVYHNKKYNDDYKDMIAVGYYRFNWCDIEPEEGKYNWKLIDDAIELYAKEGKKFAFGVKCASTASYIKYVTPQWVFDAGAKGEEKKVTFGLTGIETIQIIPNWTDDIFLEKLNHFIQALGERYDGNPNIAYIDIRSYGNYGEQHLGSIGGEEITPEQLKELYIQPYRQAFSETLLVNPWGRSEYDEIYQWSVENGVSIRTDGILYGNSKAATGKVCAIAKGKLPTIFEFAADYETLKEKQYWSEERLLECINIGKPSYMQLDIDMYDENKEFCEMLANKIGYYFRFKEAEYTNAVTSQEQNKIKLKFSNEGVAPLYEPCTVYIGLLDENYQLVKKYKTDIDPHKWMPDEETEENISLQLDGVEDGKYIISLGLFLHEDDDQPTYLLGSSGKTNDNWYVFGEINIQNPEEEYTIKAENDKFLVNAIDGYKVNIQVNNVRKNAIYCIKIYHEGELLKEIPIDNTIETYNENLNFALLDGNQIYTIQIEKNKEVVYDFTKEVYVSNFMKEYQTISNTATEKYTEFETKFANEIMQIPGYSERISGMKNYMMQVGKISETILESSSIEAMELHYDLGNYLLQAYQEGALDIEYVKLSSMLDMLDDIGTLYEYLVTVTARTRNPNLEQTVQTIQKVESLIVDNEDLGIVYPNKILEFSKDYYEKVEYICELEEENDIKTGLIISKNLHSRLLANWANTFTNIYIDSYIANNPVEIRYSETNWTNQNVKAFIQTEANIEMKNGEKEYTFTENGHYTFEYTIRGREFTIEAIVDNIDKTFPIIENVIEGKVYTENIVPKILDENLEKIELSCNGQVVEAYQLNDAIEEEGIYLLKAIDKAGNTTTVQFQILNNQQEDFQIGEGFIKNIAANTSKEIFSEKLGLGVNYEIQREEQSIESDENIATGDKLVTENGDIYILIVAGDINKDGIVNIKDIVKMRKYLLERNNLDEIEILAADANNDEKAISIKDLVRMRILSLSKENITKIL